MTDSVKFSFHNDVNGHFSLIDHFMCSSSCVGDNVNMTHILVHGANTSDHLAISCNRGGAFRQLTLTSCFQKLT